MGKWDGNNGDTRWCRVGQGRAEQSRVGGGGGGVWICSVCYL